MLMPLGNTSVDARLVALNASNYRVPPWGTQVPDICIDTQAYRLYESAVADAFDLALCPEGVSTLQAPRTDLLSSYRFGRHGLSKSDQDRYDFLYRELIEPQLSKRPEMPVSLSTLGNVCRLVEARRHGIDPLSPDAGGSMRLRFPIVDAVTGAAIPHVPIRFLWGSRHKDPSSQAYTARRGLFLRTDENGLVELPVTRAMVDEQGVNFADYREQLRYAAIPLTRDRVSFSSGRNFIGAVPDGSILHDNYLRRISSLVQSTELEHVTVAQFEQIASQGSLDGELVGNSFWRYPSEVKALQQMRSEEEARVAKEAGKTKPFAVHAYVWRWPGIALLWRSYALLTSPVDVEDDERARANLLRREVAGTFDRLCSEPDQLMSPLETGEALQMFWWIEAQLAGREGADVHARERAVTWDHGVLCEYEGARQLSLGRSRDAFRSHTLCETWKSFRKNSRDVDAVIATEAPALSELRIDYSHRAHACPDIPDNGAFQ